MRDQAFREALRKRDDLKRQLAEVEEFLRLWSRVFGTEADPPESTTVQPGPAQALAMAGANFLRRSPSRSRISEIARKVLLDNGLPMTRGELVAAFQRESVPVGGSDPKRNMGTIMWRLRDQFVNLEGHGYWPNDTALPEFGFRPELPEARRHDSKE